MSAGGDPTAFRPMTTVAGRDTPVGFELEPIVKTVTLDKSRIYHGWPAVKSRHTDYEAAAATGLPAPNVAGVQTAEALGELFIKFFGVGYLGGTLSLSYIKVVDIDAQVTARAVVRDRTEEGSSVRLHLDVWVENADGEKVIVGKASGLVP